MNTGEVLRRTVFNLLDASKGGKLQKLKEVNKREIVEGVTEEYMERRLKTLLDYVKKNSSFYRKHPEWKELKDFPVMTKGDFIEHYDEVLVDHYQEQGKLFMFHKNIFLFQLTVPPSALDLSTYRKGPPAG